MHHSVPQKCLNCLVGLFAFSLVFGAFSLHAAEPALLSPTCKNPAPLKGKWDPQASGYIIVYKKDLADPAKATAHIASKHGLTVDHDLASVGMFSTRKITPRQLAKLRCESQIAFIEYDSSVSISGK